ncbi:hypothetical protein SERLA73DRAFT_100669 [Serpula lacrymans var. lacrymans S7.3]|uniref:cDENN domain-containing protein n=2 Tax=Serpula lacrymans var. lacrymans TaxID=341189 RepID=F8PG99_SERL3|nr:uncharacterized protein SERLADRAFT_444395 [Serpula lacrymans var. lacrymans S7.9]EGO04806.1 hypothetical protein SERLA73DRAFT_100669 [Serpula lacrymans var. lacrymans S7.3]EGO30639.1 hypothetical protein SERLADRAFT_444395 [Serpula lacrymans var. lacrymans S7.9]
MKTLPSYNGDLLDPNLNSNCDNGKELADELDYITVTRTLQDVEYNSEHIVGNSIDTPPSSAVPTNYHLRRPDKASRVLGIQHRMSMEPLPASSRTSIMSGHTARGPRKYPYLPSSLPLTSLYVVSGLPKSPYTWTLADPDSVFGLHHTEGAVNRWWRPEVLGSTVSPGACGSRKKTKSNRSDTDLLKGAGTLSKQEVGKMLSKALKLSFTREVEIVASTLQPASTVHTFTFTLATPATPLAPTHSGDLLRSSVFTVTEHSSNGAFAYPLGTSHARPASLGVPSIFAQDSVPTPVALDGSSTQGRDSGNSSPVTYHGVCLTVWSHADTERAIAIRRTLETGRSRKESAQSHIATRLRVLQPDICPPKVSLSNGNGGLGDPILRAHRNSRRSNKGFWTDGETDAETEGEGAISESDFEVASSIGHGPGESTLFVPGDTIFWLPYALTLVSRHPVYDLMRDYLTLSWARFSKDVQSHTLQISKILSHPAPRAGDLIKLDASANDETDLEVIARFPGGLDFGRGLVDINFTMWPLFKCLNIDHILTICEIALAPTGRILFFSRHPAMLGIAVATVKYLVELRGWNGIALAAIHSRDAKIYVDDPGPWIMGLATEARFSIRPGPEVCVCDLDINFLSCPSPPKGIVSTKQQRDRYRQKLLAAFEPHYHLDHSVPSEFKEAFPAGRFRPVCKIQAKRGAETAAIADTIKPPEWWHSTRIIQAFDAVLQDKLKKPSIFKRISSFNMVKHPPQLTHAEQLIQYSIRKRATAFVDARDDLETKIGRLSRRLNFLMSESDLWRDKFVTFEHYAEKLSVEASDLRTKINREQKETKRLNGLVTLTTSEKANLQNQLHCTELAHQEALRELGNMKDLMETMEHERAEMVAEVEAQIERALASMAVDSDESDYNTESRPGSRLSSLSDVDCRRHRSVGTESAFVNVPEVKEEINSFKSQKGNRSNEEMVERTLPETKRFSATQSELVQDGMMAVDQGISEQSDRIAQKVKQIQQKLESALITEARYLSTEDDEEIAADLMLPQEAANIRRRRDTVTSMQTISTTHQSCETMLMDMNGVQPPSHSGGGLCARKDLTNRHSATSLSKELHRVSLGGSLCGSRTNSHHRGVSTSPTVTPAISTDDSDEFRSAYSTSSRDSDGSCLAPLIPNNQNTEHGSTPS